MPVNDTKIRFLGEMIGLDDLIIRVEAMARAETSIPHPWFIGECVYSCGNLPLTIPFETFGDFAAAFSNRQHLSSVTNDSGGLRFSFTIVGESNAFDHLTSDFYLGAVSENITKEFTRVAKKYEKYNRGDFINKESLWKRYMEEIYAPLKGVAHLGYRG